MNRMSLLSEGLEGHVGDAIVLCEIIYLYVNIKLDYLKLFIFQIRI